MDNTRETAGKQQIQHTLQVPIPQAPPAQAPALEAAKQTLHGHSRPPLDARHRSLIAAAVLALGALSWVVYLAGVAASQHIFHSEGGDYGISDYDDYGGGGDHDDYSGVSTFSEPSSSGFNLLGMSWFLVLSQLALLVSAATLLIKGVKGEVAQAFVLLIAVHVAWLGLEADEALMLVGMASNATNTWAAGAILSLLADVLLLLIFHFSYLRPDALVAGLRSCRDSDAPQVGQVQVVIQ